VNFPTWGKWVAGGVGAIAGISAVLFINVSGNKGPGDAAPLPVAPAEYAALGDSYSSGEGLPPYVPGTQDIADQGNRCHRSDHAYGVLLGGKGYENSPNFVACAGARLDHIDTREQHHDDGRTDVPVGGIQDRRVGQPAVITMTISGNDAEFAKILLGCAKRFGCLDDEWAPDSFDPVRPGAPADERTLHHRAEARVKQLEGGVKTLLDRLSERFPDTRILVLGYPRLFPRELSHIGQQWCRVFPAAYSKGERAGLRALGDQLNAGIARAALAAGVEYVQIADSFEGHEACGAKGQWINFVRGPLSELTEKNTFDRLFHPTADGQRMIGRVVGCYWRHHAQAPSNANTEPDGTKVSVIFATRAVGVTGDAVNRCATS
jgi:hypothetical protein